TVLCEPAAEQQVGHALGDLVVTNPPGTGQALGLDLGPGRRLGVGATEEVDLHSSASSASGSSPKISSTASLPWSPAGAWSLMTVSVIRLPASARSLRPKHRANSSSKSGPLASSGASRRITPAIDSIS